MRLLIMFDLPVQTPKNRRDYRKFRAYLITSGFLMMQESIYCKLCANQNAADTILKGIRQNKPPDGLVQALLITEKQYSKIEMIVGIKQFDVINSEDGDVYL